MPRKEQVKAGLIEWNVVDEGTANLDGIVDEVEYALYPPKHEGKLPTYGCVIAADAAFSATTGAIIQEVPPHLAREMSDGVSSFAVNNAGHTDRVALLTAAHDEELQLIELTKQWKGVLIHRNRREVVRVFTDNAIHIYEAGEWKIRPYAESVLWKTIKAVPQANHGVLDGLTTLAFHDLSPSNVGTTLVWWLDTALDLPKDGADLSTLGLNVTAKLQYPAIRSLLRRHDGAVFVSPSGQILSLGHHLQYSDNAARIIPQVGGTRHTSAKRFSFDEPRVVIVTVSEDGPVSVFSDGAKVTELDETRLGGTANYLATLVPEKAIDIETYAIPLECPNCGKGLDVEVVILYGWRDRETGECPVCDATVYEKLCWKIIPRLVKRLPQPKEE